MNFRAIGYHSFLEKSEYVSYAFHDSSRRWIPMVSLWISVGVISVLGLRFLALPYSSYLEYVIVLIAAFRVMSHFWGWYMKAMLITDRGLVFVDWRKFFHKKVRRIDYQLLEEVEYEQEGIGDFLFNTGNVHFQRTSGEVLTLSKVSRPRHIMRLVQNQHTAFLNNKNFTEESELKNIISQLVLTHSKKGDNLPVIKRENTMSAHTKKKPKNNRKSVEIEKILDDDGGFEIDLEDLDENK